jgi:hypothetical protein
VPGGPTYGQQLAQKKNQGAIRANNNIGRAQPRTVQQAVQQTAMIHRPGRMGGKNNNTNLNNQNNNNISTQTPDSNIPLDNYEETSYDNSDSLVGLEDYQPHNNNYDNNDYTNTNNYTDNNNDHLDYDPHQEHSSFGELTLATEALLSEDLDEEDDDLVLAQLDESLGKLKGTKKNLEKIRN